jgi:NOL1/NOP2/fmu family ribosome biogenesis protein
MAIQLPEGFEIDKQEDQFILQSIRHSDSIKRIADLKGSFKNTMPLGIMKGKDFIPSHELAMTDLLVEPRVIILDASQSLKYLRRETFPLQGVDDGWYLASYEKVALGWIKIASGKMKNHYPKGWMIRKRW